tara:strand:+ start:90 stop:1028 length:939 start_codon:yes stop_codon:yes gene_type:complete
MNNLSNNNYLKMPILIIAFNRPTLVGKLIDKLKYFKPENIYVAVDGPRERNLEDQNLCDDVKNLINKKINWNCNLYKNYQTNNLGTKNAVYSAIKWFFQNVEMGIILEDDIDPDISFFKFSEILLNKYKLNEKIKMISGNNYFNNNDLVKSSYYFCQSPGTHGWATWRRTWNDLDIEMSDWNKNRNFFSMYSFFGFNLSRIHYFFKRFDLSHKKLIDSWDYQFFYSIVKKRGLIIKPAKNLCKHIGWGPDATRGKGKDTFPDIKSEKINFPLIHPNKIIINKKLDIMEDKIVRKLNFFNYFYSLIKKKLFKK